MDKDKQSEVQMTVHEATYNLLRHLGLTTVFGNPGSTEQPFLKNFPKDFQYVLGLQEASVVAMADGFAQGTRKPVLVNLHSGAGTGNGMCNIMTAFQNKTPLIITAGQQTREMILGDPYLTNRDETLLPRPWVKWAYQPVRAQDVPGAIIRAYAIAVQPSAGPVYVSIPLDDWDQPALGEAVVRTVSSRCAPDPERLTLFAERMKKSKNPVLVYGPEIERAGGWEAGVRFAERLKAPVYISPLTDRASFPQTHPQFRGMVPIAIGPLSKKLQGHDLIIVIGAQVFRYYPFIPGDHLPEGAELLQVTNDPWDAAAAVAGDSLLSDAGLALEAFIDAIPAVTSRPAPAALPIERKLPSPANNPLTALEAFAALSALRPRDAILVNETGALLGALPTTGLPVNYKDSSWFLIANWSQYLFLKDNRTAIEEKRKSGQTLRGVGIFARAGYAPPATTTVTWDAIVGLFASSLIDGRPLDSFGVGFYDNALSNNFKNSIARLTQGTSSAADERGIELFYDFAITPAIGLNVSYQHVWNPLIAQVTENQNDANVFLTRLNVTF